MLDITKPALQLPYLTAMSIHARRAASPPLTQANLPSSTASTGLDCCTSSWMKSRSIGPQTTQSVHSGFVIPEDCAGAGGGALEPHCGCGMLKGTNFYSDTAKIVNALSTSEGVPLGGTPQHFAASVTISGCSSAGEICPEERRVRDFSYYVLYRGEDTDDDSTARMTKICTAGCSTFGGCVNPQICKMIGWSSTVERGRVLVIPGLVGPPAIFQEIKVTRALCKCGCD